MDDKEKAFIHALDTFRRSLENVYLFRGAAENSLQAALDHSYWERQTWEEYRAVLKLFKAALDKAEDDDLPF